MSVISEIRRNIPSQRYLPKMSKLTYIFFCLVAASLAKVSNAVTDEEKVAFQAAMAPIIAECSEEHGVSEGEIKAAKEARNPDGIKPCFLGCVMKKTEVLDDKGLYNAEKGLANLKQFIKNEEEFAKIEEVGKLCSSVNDKAVTDGEAGCERAKLVLSCFLEHKPDILI